MKKPLVLLAVLLIAVLIWSMAGHTAGSQYRSQTATVTTDANTFSVEHVFDLGIGPHPVQITVTGLTLNGNGETFGNDAGTIYVEPDFGSSPTNGSFVGLTIGSCIQTGGPGAGCTFEVQKLAQAAVEVTVAGRYLELVVRLVSNDNGLLYAGNNHPTAQVRIDLTYG